MTVYIDSFVIINLALNYLILLAVKKMLRSAATKPRIFAGSVIGTVYALFMFVPSASFLFGFFGKLAFSLLLVAVTYKYKSRGEYIKTVIVFYIISFAFGGCVYALTGQSEFALSLKIVVTAAVCAYFLIDIFSAFYKKLCCDKNNIVNVKICVNSKEISFDALVDTGNCLTDPVSRLPVIVVELSLLRKVLPAAICTAYDAGLDACDVAAVTKSILLLRLVPYKSLGEDNGFIAGFVPKKAEIDGRETKCLIGIYDKRLSSDGMYCALINPILV